jgi:hypothetical protein
MANLKGCFSHNSDDWKTPKEIYDYFIDKGYIDPCPYQCEVDNLNCDMGGGKPFYQPTL